MPLPEGFADKLLERGPKYFTENRLRQMSFFLHRLEYIFPEVDLENITVDELWIEVTQAIIKLEGQADVATAPVLKTDEA